MSVSGKGEINRVAGLSSRPIQRGKERRCLRTGETSYTTTFWGGKHKLLELVLPLHPALH
jgi:hypothetical protein